MSKIVMLDAGHGGHDSGAVGNGLREKDLTLRMALRVRDILQQSYEGVIVRMTRTTDKYLSLAERTRMANNAKANYFFSFHINAGGGTGYEDFIWNKLATNSATDKSRQKVHNAVKPVLSKYGIRNRGMKKANFHVLRETLMQAVLVETLFIDNANDAKLLKNNNFIEDICQAYAKGIADVLGAKKKAAKPAPTPKPTPTPNTSGKLYRVQVGAYRVRSNADNMLKQVKAKGFDGFVKYVNGLYKIQVGVYSVKANADAMKAKVEKAGFKAFITTE